MPGRCPRCLLPCCALFSVPPYLTAVPPYPSAICHLPTSIPHLPSVTTHHPPILHHHHHHHHYHVLNLSSVSAAILPFQPDQHPETHRIPPALSALSTPRIPTNSLSSMTIGSTTLPPTTFFAASSWLKGCRTPGARQPTSPLTLAYFCSVGTPSQPSHRALPLDGYHHQIRPPG